MPTEPAHLLILISDNRGEQDYIKSIATLVKEEVAASHGSLTYSVFKQVKQADNSYQLFQLRDLPSTSAQLTAMTLESKSVTSEEIGAQVKTRGGLHRIIAGGNNTLNQAVRLQNTIMVVSGIVCDISYVTHRLNEHDKSTLFGHWVEFITPQPKDDVARIFEVDLELVRHRHIDLSAIPHSYTLENCIDSWEIFQDQASSNEFAAQVVQQVRSGNPMALVVLPGGFANIDKRDLARHVPYQEYEAYTAGNGIGRYLPPNTMIVITDGGPRNRKDYAVGHDTMRSFATGYLHGQQGMTHDAGPVIAMEPFSDGMAYDTTKVFIALAHLYPHQIAFLFIAAEGNAMRSAVIEHIDLNRVASGMLLSDVLLQRGDNLQPDQEAGIPIVDFQQGHLVFNKTTSTQPFVKRRSPARVVMEALGFGK